MGINNAELFNNLGLCCFYAQQVNYSTKVSSLKKTFQIYFPFCQYDMALACMERALSLADEDTLGNLNYYFNFPAEIGIKFPKQCTCSLPQPKSGTTFPTLPCPWGMLDWRTR